MSVRGAEAVSTFIYVLRPNICLDLLVWKGKQSPRYFQVALVLKELKFHLPSKSKTKLDKNDTSHSPL